MTGPGAAPGGLALAGGSPAARGGARDRPCGAAWELPGFGAGGATAWRGRERGREQGPARGPSHPEPQELQPARRRCARLYQKTLLCAFHPSRAGPRMGGVQHTFRAHPPSSRPQPEAQPVSGHEQPRNEPWAPRGILSGCRRTGGVHGTETFFPPALLFSRGCLLGTKAWGIAQPWCYCLAGPVINRQPVPSGSGCNQETIGTFHTSSSTVCRNPQPGRHRGHGTG